MPILRLITKAQWDTYTPHMQGYVKYAQGGFPGSELRDVENPYPVDSEERREFAAGEFTAMMDAQDGEE